MDRADAAEEKVRQMTDKLERIEEELRDTQKKMMQTENDLDKAQEDLSVANSNLEEKEKKVQEDLLVVPLPAKDIKACTFDFQKFTYPASSDGQG
ncbi:unnamed protein product [Toxocara canis]|uniref:Tropomyosin n=1 Tax=Toxocara canis TaxID=6265 RepID=A0A3P7IXN0_TOXCA|nr:unnamed protein product [Toxocara canis]